MDSQGDSLIATPGFGRGFSFVISQRKNHGSRWHFFNHWNMWRVLVNFLGLILLLFTSCASAVVPMAERYNMYRNSQFESGTSFFASREAAVNSWCAWYMSRGYAELTSCKFAGGNTYSYEWAGSVNKDGLYESKKLSCPDNSINPNGTNYCVCDAGWVENATKTACEAPPPKCTAGKVIESDPQAVWSGSQSGVFCVDGCQVYGTDRVGDGKGKWWTYGPFTESGGECRPPPSNDPPPPDNEPPNICKKGQCPGQVNGVDICVPCREQKDDPPKPPNPTASDPPPSDKPPDKTNTTTKEEPDGGRTTTTTNTSSSTNCSGDSCKTTTTTTTTTTTKDKDGNITSGPTTSTKAETSEQKKSSFCAENPSSWMCKGPETSSFGGSCGGAYVCQGDAIQCAIAQDQLKRNCQAYDAKGTLEQNEYASGVGNTGNVTLDNPNNATSTMSGPNSRGDLLVGGGGGVSDKSVQILGGTFVIPMTQLNDALPWIGYAFLALCTVVAFMIIWRRDFA